MLPKLSRSKDTELRFETTTNQRLFNILLVDFLSPPGNRPFDLAVPPRDSSETDRTVLFHLKGICSDPKLNPAGGDTLKLPLDAFVRWLETECCVEDVWLPAIELKTDIKVKRITFIKICGNIAKHSFTRLSANVREICEILEANGNRIDSEEAYLVIPEFY